MRDYLINYQIVRSFSLKTCSESVHRNSNNELPMLGYRLSGQWMASPDPIRFTIKRFNENMTQNYNNGVVIITDPGYYAVTAFFHVWADSYTAIMKNYKL